MDPSPENGESSGERPELEFTFPCTWTYMVVVEERAHLDAALLDVLAGERYELEASRTSQGGRYRSFHLQVEVASDERRLTIFRRLHEDARVKYVM